MVLSDRRAAREQSMKYDDDSISEQSMGFKYPDGVRLELALLDEHGDITVTTVAVNDDCRHLVALAANQHHKTTPGCIVTAIPEFGYKAWGSNVHSIFG